MTAPEPTAVERRVAPLRVGVTGGRTYDDDATIRAELARIPIGSTLVHGNAPGADTLAATIWSAMFERAEAHPADWGVHGKAAGPLRNQEMVDSGLDLLIAFPGGRGTADMIRRAEAAGVPVRMASDE